MQQHSCSKLPWLGAGLVLVILTGTLFAGGTSKTFEQEMRQSLADLITQGSALFNKPKNDYIGCFRLYEGALISVRPALRDYPDLQKSIDTGLAAARKEDPCQGSFVLRKVLDDIRAKLKDAPRVKTPGGAPDPNAKTLWGRLGGEEGVGKILDEFFAAAGKDPKVNADRNGTFPHDEAFVKNLKQLFTEFLSSHTDGPLKYSGRSMKASHKGLHIKESEFDAAGGHFKAAMEKFKVAPADVNAVVKILGSFKKDIVEPEVKVVQPNPNAKTLWGRLGGEEGVGKILDEFFAAAGKDPKVNADRNGAFPHDEAFVKNLKLLFTEFLSSHTDGPLKYSGRSMKASHKGLHIKESEFDAAGGHFKAAMEKFKVAPADVNAVMKILGSFKKDIVQPAMPPADARKLWERLDDKVRASVATNQAVSPKFSGRKNTWFVADDVPGDRE